jgi:hypothetical protein
MRSLLLALLLGLCAATTHAAIDPDRIDRSLARAKEYLYKQFADDNWEKALEHHGDQKTGHTALVVYALLSAGEDPTEPRIAKAIQYLRKTDTTGIYALGIRCQVWLLLPRTDPENRRMMNKDAAKIRSAILTDGEGKGYYEYNPGAKYWSRSRAQYAVLGMWAAAQAGIEVPDAYWQMVEKAWIADQDKSGAWNYLRKPSDEYPLTPGMTAVGIATLYITQDYLHSSDVGAARGNPVSPNIDRGMKWMIDNFAKVATDEKYDRAFQYATCYAVERIGVASGLKRFGTIDWYDKCANWLMEMQLASGAWPAEMSSNLHSTCFAVLCLARGRAAIVINKLNYSVEGAKKEAPWNQRPREIANVTRWIGRQLEHDFNWQIVDLKSPQDWHDAPVLYMGGSDELALDDASKQKLKAFLEDGGLLLGNADAASRNFGNSFRKLGQDLFKEYEFRELPAEHVIYTEQQYKRDKWKSRPSVLGLSNGVRELMILLPQADPAKLWQTSTISNREENWQLASNIVLYCSENYTFRTRGQTHLISRNANIKADRTAKLARLKYKGPWDPEPGGWRRLTNRLHNKDKVDLEVVEVDLASGSLDGFKLAHLTGTLPIKFDDAARAKLKKFVEGGGTLIIDAAGGSSDFATAMEQELAAIFPDTKLNLLPKDHALFSAGGAPMKSFTYRAYASHMVGALKDEPRLRAIELNKRPAVIFSREDLGAGMVGQNVDGIIGYDPNTATEIMARVVLYTSKP